MERSVIWNSSFAYAEGSGKRYTAERTSTNHVERMAQ